MWRETARAASKGDGLGQWLQKKCFLMQEISLDWTIKYGVPIPSLRLLETAYFLTVIQSCTAMDSQHSWTLKNCFRALLKSTAIEEFLATVMKLKNNSSRWRSARTIRLWFQLCCKIYFWKHRSLRPILRTSGTVLLPFFKKGNINSLTLLVVIWKPFRYKWRHWTGKVYQSLISIWFLWS